MGEKQEKKKGKSSVFWEKQNVSKYDSSCAQYKRKRPPFFSRMQSNMRTRGDRADKAVIVDRAA